MILKDSVELESSDKIDFIIEDRTTYADIMSQLEDPNEFIHMISGAFGKVALPEPYMKKKQA